MLLNEEVTNDSEVCVVQDRIQSLSRTALNPFFFGVVMDRLLDEVSMIYDVFRAHSDL